MNPTDEFTKAVRSALEKHTEVVLDYGAIEDPKAVNDIYEKRYDEALASIQASTVELFTRLVGEDGFISGGSIPDKYVTDPPEAFCEGYEALRQELRQHIDQLIKDLSNGE